MNFSLNQTRGILLPLLFLLTSYALPAQIASLFHPATNKAAVEDLVGKELQNYGLLEVDAESYSQLLADAPENWDLELPATPGINPKLNLKLERNEFLRHDFVLRLASDNRAVQGVNLGLHYTGSIAGEPGSRVALSLLDGELTATISRADGSRLALGKVQNQDTKSPQISYLLFPDTQLAEGQEFDCGTADSGQPYSAKELTYPADEKTNVGCIDVYFEIDFDIFSDKGSVDAAAQHLAANFNEVAALYADIGVNLRISEILVWNQISPYSGTSSSALLTQFQSNRTSFNGDVAQLVSYQASGGIAVLDGLCHPWVAARMSFSSIASNFAAVPVFSWSTMVIAHELGHLLGSQHTHACVWNGNDTAIDGCAGITEGLCGTPGIPAQGGTIMSYCHLRPQGINFNFGFGSQPSAVIANRVAAAQSCVQAVCSTPPGGGNGGGNNDDEDDEDDDDPVREPISCDQQTVFVNLTLDDFGMETTWMIKTETGTVVATGGPYPKKKKGRTFRDTVCVIDGCYVFEINDSDGDGICCTYGQGRYTLKDTLGNVLGSGGSFDTLEVVDFCLPEMEDDDDDDDDNVDGCDVISFVENTVVTYGTNQDAGTVSLTDGGNGILLENNAWKGIQIDYEMTPDTWVSFWFRSTKRGEVHGIGMDDNEVLSSNRTFKLYGTQGWGLGNFNTYSGDGNWQHFQIPLGQYYTIQAQYLFFTADHDVGTRDGNSYFRDVVITEGAPCGPAALPPTPELIPTSDSEVRLTPNPANREITIDLPETTGTVSYEVIDLTGRSLLQGTFTNGKTQLSVDDLPNGSYFFRYAGESAKGSRRFVVAR